MNLKKRDCLHSLLVILCLLSTYASVGVDAVEKELEISDAMDNTRQLASSSVWTNFLNLLHCPLHHHHCHHDHEKKESKENSNHSNQNDNPYDPYTDVDTDDETYSNIKCTSNTTTACTESITKAPTIDNGSNDSPDWWWTEARHHDAEVVKRAGVELVFAVLSVGGLAFGVTFFRKRYQDVDADGHLLQGAVMGRKKLYEGLFEMKSIKEEKRLEFEEEPITDYEQACV